MFVWPFLFKGMGGRVRLHGLPWTIFVPTQTLSHPKLPMGVKENSPAGITIPTIPSEPELLPEWTELILISEPHGHLGSKRTLDPRPCEAKRRKRASSGTARVFRIHVCDLFQSFCMSIYQSRVVIRLLVAFRFGIFEFVVCLGVFKRVG